MWEDIFHKFGFTIMQFYVYRQRTKYGEKLYFHKCVSVQGGGVPPGLWSSGIWSFRGGVSCPLVLSRENLKLGRKEKGLPQDTGYTPTPQQDRGYFIPPRTLGTPPPLNRIESTPHLPDRLRRRQYTSCGHAVRLSCFKFNSNRNT